MKVIEKLKVIFGALFLISIDHIISIISLYNLSKS